MNIEARLAEQTRRRTETYEASNSSLPDLDESCISNVDTEQVMNFIRQALKESSHLEEVQHLQKAIFDELLKYDDCSSSLKKADSMDTLHNIDDFSNAQSSRDVSPSKSFPSAFPSPPKFSAKEVSPARSSPGQEASRMVQSCAGDFARPGSAVPPESPGFKHQNQKPGTPPKLIRRNSYTLDSPSPSVLLYLKSLQIDDDISEKTLSTDKSVKRNLNDVWSEVLSMESVDTNSVTLMNQSAMSWRSEPDQLSNCDHLSLSTHVTAPNHLPHVSPPAAVSDNYNNNTIKKTSIVSKCRNNNNNVPSTFDVSVARMSCSP